MYSVGRKTITVSPSVLSAYLLLNAPFFPHHYFWQTSLIGWCACFQHKRNKYTICLQSNSPFVFWCSTIYCSYKQSLCCCFRLFVLFCLWVPKDTCREMRLCQFLHLVPAVSVCSVYCSKQNPWTVSCLMTSVYLSVSNLFSIWAHVQSGKALA